nr:MAG TPA: hypothetical protein [Caudoviricetes sp.]
MKIISDIHVFVILRDVCLKINNFKVYIIQHGCLVFLHEIHASSVSP